MDVYGYFVALIVLIFFLNRMKRLFRSTKGSKAQSSERSEGTSSNPPSVGYQGQMTSRHASLLQTRRPSLSRSAGQPDPEATESDPHRRTRSPPIDSSPSEGDGSNGVVMVPSGLFLPPLIPGIPYTDADGNIIPPVPPEVAPGQVYHYRPFDTPLHPARTDEEEETVEESVDSASTSGISAYLSYDYISRMIIFNNQG